jgi:hypothetical protein
MRMTHPLQSAALIGLLVLGICSIGCRPGATADPKVAATRERVLMREEPSGAVTFVDARSQVADRPEVTLVGRIGVPDQEPFVQGKAAFVIRDAAGEVEHGGPDHDPANCPFCKRKASQPEAMAVVQFLDDKGEVLPIDARELFDLSENARVVVQGKAQIVEPGALVVSAERLFVTRK